MQVAGKVDERCPPAERPAPSRRWAGGRSGGSAGRDPLAPAPRLRPRSAAAREGGATGPGTGQRIPARRACCPVVTPAPRSAGVNDRRRRRAPGAARSAGGPGRPSAVTTSPYRLATPHGPRHWQGRAPAPAPPPPLWGRPGIAAPRPFPLCAARSDRAWSLLASRRATVPARHGRRPNSVPTRGEVGEGHGKVRAHGGLALPRPGRASPEPGTPAAPALPRPPVWAGRGSLARCPGKGARLCSPRPGQGPLLPWSSGEQGLASPRL